MKQVRIKLGKDGSIKSEAFGFKGPECKNKTSFLNDIFGDSDTEELKQSYYEESESETTFESNGLPSGWCG